MVSNGCDAITKYRMTNPDDESEMSVMVTVDKENKTLTISDTGIGMTEDEVKRYINQVAFSGASEFMKKFEGDEKKGDIIGHFGLGFYSVFMVSENVEIETLSCFSNHNKMLSLYEGANGIKTGFTKSTGRCLVSSAQRDGMEFIAVTLNDSNDWNDHAEMLDYAFSEHYPKKLIEQGDTVKVTNIDGKDYSMVAASDFTIPFKEHQKTQVEVISHISNDLQAPINQGEKVGWLEIVCDGVSVGEVDIISENDIYGVSNIRLKNSFFSSFIRVAKILLV